jgi:hypothetical protein
MTPGRFRPAEARVDVTGRRREDGNVDSRTPSQEPVVAALCAALAPYPWRHFTPELLARFALAVRDRQELAAVLSEVPGAVVGTWQRLEPAERSDARVPRIVELLADVRWAELSLPAMCRNLAGLVGPELR